MFFHTVAVLIMFTFNTARSVDFCELPVSYGNCSSSLTRWFYDTKTHKCRKFIFTGCGANDNNFASYTSCLLACGSNTCSQSCGLALKLGDCPLELERWFFNTRTQRCERFVYTGCQGNSNNFESEIDCKMKCLILPPFCYIQPKQDNCNAEIWHYNPVSGTCEQSIGCDGGNANSFKTLYECLEICS